MASGIGSVLGSVVGGVMTGGMGPIIAEGVKDAMPAAAEVAKTLAERLIPDPAARAAAQLALEQALASRDVAAINAAATVAVAQSNINLAEAQGNDRYSARWRPTVGWVGAIAFAYTFVLAPVFTMLINIANALSGAAIPPAPGASMELLMPLMLSLLGLTASRTYERTQGVPGALPPALPAPQR